MKTLDSAAGMLQYDYGWVKQIDLKIHDVRKELPLVFEAFENEIVSDEQLKSYTLFCNKKTEFELEIPKLLNKYISVNGIQNPSINPTSLFIKRNGRLGLLCDCNWDIEQGIVIILYPEQEITEQDAFL